MPTRIRLQRKGKKGKPFYHLVIADGRAPRDGKFIEKIGTYNPLSDPATIELNFDRALYWLQVGAQPSETARSILSREGVMLKEHLLRGVKKGALTEDQVEEKFKTWLKEKAEKVEQSAKNAELSERELKKLRLEEEKKINQVRADELAKKYAKETLKAAEPTQESAEEVEEAETPSEEPAAE
jgi:small subunit ribosomal protein S16